MKEEVLHKVCNNWDRKVAWLLGCLFVLWITFESHGILNVLNCHHALFFDACTTCNIFVVIHFKEIWIASNKSVVCLSLLLVTMTLPFLLLKAFYDKTLSVGDMFVCGIFFPKIFTKGVLKPYKITSHLNMFIWWDNMNKQMKENTDVVTSINYGVVLFLSWSKCIYNLKMTL